MKESNILEQFFEEQHRKWKKNIPQFIRKEINLHSEPVRPLKQRNQSEPVASHSSHEDKKK